MTTTTTIADLARELVEEILSRVPITSIGAVRSTCKRWNALSKEKILCKAEEKHQFLGFMMKKYKLCSVRFDLEGEEFADPCIKELDCNVLRDQEEALEVSKVFQCDGLVLCATRDYSKLVVWNPYLGQTRWIQPINSSTPYHIFDRYAIGYDNNRKHKILRFLDYYDFSVENRFLEYEIYDLSSNSWRVITTPDWHIDYFQRGASLKGNTYFLASKAILEPSVGGGDAEFAPVPPCVLLCFDFTTESFGQTLPLPLDYYSDFDTGALSSLVGDQKLAFLFQAESGAEVEIWVTTSMIPNAAAAAVSWIPFLKIDMEPHYGFAFHVYPSGGSFFIDEEKKLAVVIDYDESEYTRHADSAYVIGDNGYLKKFHIGEAVPYIPGALNFIEFSVCCPLVTTPSFFPSLVQINQIAGFKKEREEEDQPTSTKMKKKKKKTLY